MTLTAETPSKYDLAAVAQAVLVEVIDLHPERLTVPEWSLRIAGDPDDGREVGTVADAIRELRRWGLVRYRRTRVVEPTQAALRAVALLVD